MQIRAFDKAARAALAAWREADEHARAVGLPALTDDDTRTVRRMRSALDLALDDSAAAAERDTAVQTVGRLAGDLAGVPERILVRTAKALGSVTRKQLTR